MTGDRFERDLADALAARDPGAVPATLTARVIAIPDRAPVGTFRRFRLTLTGLAAAAVVGLLAIGLAWGLRTAPTGPGASGGPEASSPLPPSAVVQPGDGAVPVDPPWGHAILIGVLLTLATVGAIRTSGKRRIIPLSGAVVVLVAAFSLANLDVLHPISSSAHMGGTRAVDQDGSEIDVQTVGPNVLIPVGIWLTNGSGLPITIRGLAAPQATATVGNAPPRVVALAAPRDEMATDFEGTPFQPVTLQPGKDVGVYVYVNSGDCATTFDSETRIVVKSVDIAVDVLGMTRVEPVTFAEIWIPQGNCSP